MRTLVTAIWREWGGGMGVPLSKTSARSGSRTSDGDECMVQDDSSIVACVVANEVRGGDGDGAATGVAFL